MSSYDTSGSLSSFNSGIASGLNTTSVASVIITASFAGLTSTIMNLRSPRPNPISASSPTILNISSKNGLCDIALLLVLVPPNETMSPLTTALPRSPCLNIIGLARIRIPSFAGAIIIFFASLTFAFRTEATSPMPVFAFLRIRPSIRIILSPISPGYALSTIATVFLPPCISTISPDRTPTCFMYPESTLTIPLVTSSCIASATLSFTSGTAI